MKTIDEKVRDVPRCREAQENLDEFYKKIKLISHYPVKPLELPPQAPPWKISKIY